MIVRFLSRCVQSPVAAFLRMLLVIVFVCQFFDLSLVTQSLIRIQSPSKIIYSGDFDCSRNCSEFASPTTNVSGFSSGSCPDYFKWIYEDLKPWKETGVTEEMVEKSAKLGHLRIVIAKGRLHFEKIGEVFQTRDVVTLWGILQMIRLYPGRVPDLEMVINCNDRTTVKRKDYCSHGDSSGCALPPPLFHYCGDEDSYDIVFPDWSFWGWPEINIKPWESLQEELEKGNARIKWRDREPFAYWKGTAGLGSTRNRLLTCNVTKEHDWNARIFNMDWKKEKRQGFSNSDLSNQCNHRYKIYAEGNSWSLITGLSTTAICDSIRFAVEWGNSHPEKAEEIGKAGSKFVKENLEMKHIYDYMFHLMNEYSKLMKYKPAVPQEATETCSEMLVCSDRGQKRRFKKHSMVKSSSDSPPCELSSSHEDDRLRAFVDRKESLLKLVSSLEENTQ